MSMIDSAFADHYVAPAADMSGVSDDIEPAPVWAVIVGGSLALGFAYGAYCTATGGSFHFSWTWRGLKVTCDR
ncbi:MAG: hypothetical protein AAF548_00055 [Actinomycetota bacterium]